MYFNSLNVVNVSTVYEHFRNFAGGEVMSNYTYDAVVAAQLSLL